jgi:hypothetical protein
MGKAAIILVSAVTLASAAAYMTQDRQSMESMRQEALYEHQVLAREIAQSGFNRIESRVRRDFEQHRLNVSDLPTRPGSVDISAVGASGSDVTISATGRYEGAEYTITGVLSRQGSRVLDALTVDASVADVDFRGNARVSGIDTNPDGTDGPNDDVHAVLATNSDAYGDFTAEMQDGDGVGRDGLEDVLQSLPEINLATLGNNISDYSGPGRVDYTGNTVLDNEVVGSVATPAVTVVAGNLTLSGSTTGYGILMVDGSLTMEGNARWEGLVLIQEDGGAHIFGGNARVYGAVVVRSVAENGSGNPDDQGLPGGHFDVDVFKAFQAGQYRYHEHKYDDDYDVTGVDWLNPDRCENGGVCWDEILGGAEAVYVSFKNEERGYGTYELESGAGSVSNTCSDDLGANDSGSLDLDPSMTGYSLTGNSGSTRPGSIADLGVGASLGGNLPALLSALGGGKKVKVCHSGKKKKVKQKDLAKHLAHGDTLGDCGDGDDDDDRDDSNGNGSDSNCGGAGQLPAVDLQGNTHEGLAPTLLHAGQMINFKVNFEYLCALQISSPNGVIYDPSDRNGAFTVQIYEAVRSGSTWSQGDLLYETSIYHHTGYGWWDDPGGDICDPQLGGGGDQILVGRPVEFDLVDNALIQYSSAVLIRMKEILAQVNPGQGSIRLGSTRQTGLRQRELTGWQGTTGGTGTN